MMSDTERKTGPINTATLKMKELTSRYTSHRADVDGVEAMRTIRRAVRQLAYEIERTCPDGRSKASAFTHLDSVMTCANFAIAQTFPVDESDV